MPEDLKRLLKRSATLVALVRHARALGAKRKRARLMSPPVYLKQIDGYLRAHSVRKLQIGSGPVSLPGWLNTDFYPVAPADVFMDATKPFPFADRTFDYVFSEHVIEHLTYVEGLFLLSESFRVLKPGGTIRVATPDLKRMVDLFSPQKTASQQRYLEWSVKQFSPAAGIVHECFVLNNMVRNWGHQFIYDPETLQGALAQAGFTAVTQHSPGLSDDPNLSGVESHGQQLGEEWNQFETMALEGQRPR